MSYKDGWAALNLEMPPRVPRTEYSADSHWELVRAQTGIEVSFDSTESIKQKARRRFREMWNYDLCWGVLPSSCGDFFGEVRTRMGHASYASGGVDFDNVVLCPFKTVEDVLNFDPIAVFGTLNRQKLVEEFERNYRDNCESNPDGISMTGTYCSCVSGLIELFGWDMMLLAMGSDAERFGEMVNRYASWMQQFYEAMAASNVPVIMLHDDITWTSGPFAHPDWYRKYVFGHYKKYCAPLRESGKKILFTSDGNYSVFIDDIVACGIHGFVLEPDTDMQYIASKYGKTHVFIGNADTRILLNGTKDDIELEVKRCMDIGKKFPGFFMAVGNHIPSNTPVENAMFYNECYEKLGRR